MQTRPHSKLKFQYRSSSAFGKHFFGAQIYLPLPLQGRGLALGGSGLEFWCRRCVNHSTASFQLLWRFFAIRRFVLHRNLERGHDHHSLKVLHPKPRWGITGTLICSNMCGVRGSKKLAEGSIYIYIHINIHIYIYRERTPVMTRYTTKFCCRMDSGFWAYWGAFERSVCRNSAVCTVPED